MPDWAQALLTSALTITGGLVVFVLGQLFSKSLLAPAIEMRRIIAKIAYTLELYANVYSSPELGKERALKASDEIRGLASELIAQYHTTLTYSLLSFFMVVPGTNSINTAHEQLILLSNLISPQETRGLYDKQGIHVAVGQVRESLNLAEKLP